MSVVEIPLDSEPAENITEIIPEKEINSEEIPEIVPKEKESEEKIEEEPEEKSEKSPRTEKRPRGRPKGSAKPKEAPAPPRHSQRSQSSSAVLLVQLVLGICVCDSTSYGSGECSSSTP